MIRLEFLLRRREGTTREAFQRRWREQHGPLVAGLAGVLGIRRYVQVHTREDELGAAMRRARGGMEEPYDGVAEVSWDYEAVLAGAFASEEGQRAAAALLEDEAAFIDHTRSPLWLAHEYPQIEPPGAPQVARPGSGLVKLVFPLRLRSVLGREAGQRIWHTEHGPLIRSLSGALDIRRYLQVHRYESPLEPLLRASRGVAVDTYDGHAELWLDRAALAQATPDRAAAGAAAVRDEARFIDFARSSIWLADEHVLVDRAGAAAPEASTAG